MRPDSRDEISELGSKAFFPASTMSSIIFGWEFLEDEELAILLMFPSQNRSLSVVEGQSNPFIVSLLEPSCIHHTVHAFAHCTHEGT